MDIERESSTNAFAHGRADARRTADCCAAVAESPASVAAGDAYPAGKAGDRPARGASSPAACPRAGSGRAQRPAPCGTLERKPVRDAHARADIGACAAVTGATKKRAAAAPERNRFLAATGPLSASGHAAADAAAEPR